MASVSTRPSPPRSGDLVYFDRRTSLQQRDLVRVNRSGQAIAVVGEPQARVERIDVSPSGRFVAVAAEEGGCRRIWVHDVNTGGRFALSPMPDPGQRWPPDERRVVFRFRQGRRSVFRDEVSGSRVATGHARTWLVSCVRAGWRGPLRSGRRYLPRGPERSRASGGGAGEIRVTRYEKPSESWQVSQDGGEDRKWRGDGRELFYTKGTRCYPRPSTSRGACRASGARCDSSASVRPDRGAVTTIPTRTATAS